jgi:DNA repair protein RadC
VPILWTLAHILGSPQMQKIASLPYEVSVILYITPQRVRALKQYDKVGTAEVVEIPDVREVVRGCRENNTNQVILVHNHPPIKGVHDASPSEADLIATRKFMDDLRKLGIVLLDHIIVSQKNYFSFKENNLI